MVNEGISFFCLQVHFFVASWLTTNLERKQNIHYSPCSVLFSLQSSHTFNAKSQKDSGIFNCLQFFWQISRKKRLQTSQTCFSTLEVSRYRFWGTSHKWKIKGSIKFTQKSVMPLNSWNMIFKISWVQWKVALVLKILFCYHWFQPLLTHAEIPW